MKYINLGKSGLKVSRICLGTMNYGSPEWRDYVLSEEHSRPFIKRAIELGINFFDTADMYSSGVSEEILGRAIRDFAKRDEVVIATKVYNPTGDHVNAKGLSRKHIMDAIDGSLRRLGTDYVDLYQIHRLDRDTPIEETLEALNDIVRSGKALYIGACNMWAWAFTKSLLAANAHGWTRFVSMQIHHNLVYREEEREMLPLCLDQGIGYLPWSPLARGFLTGSRKRGESGQTMRSKSDEVAKRMYCQDHDFDVVDRVAETSARLGVKPAQVALAWIFHKQGVTAPILGASKLKHLEEAVAALKIQLSEGDMAWLEEPYKPHSMLGFR